jgi:phosphoadenosine phosphosulfate reductase
MTSLLQSNVDSNIEALIQETSQMTSEQIIYWAFQKWQRDIAIASSFGVEDVTLIHIAISQGIKPRVFFLDTGRLPRETYELVDRIRKLYGIDVDVYVPETEAVQLLTSQKGHSSFYDSIDNRLECCEVRKTQPLKRALMGLDSWMTGLRREQSNGRAEVNAIQWDERNGLIKINPLADWSLDHLWTYVKDNKIPYNPLHDRGFPSIGCAPCTRAIGPGEPLRAGRWWWEDASLRECGLHGGTSQ